MAALSDIVVDVRTSLGRDADREALSLERADRAAADVAIANFATAADAELAERVTQLEERLATMRLASTCVFGLLVLALLFLTSAIAHVNARVNEHLRMFLTPSGGSILVNPLPPTAPVTPEPDEQPGDVLRQGGPTQSVGQVATEVSRA